MPYTDDHAQSFAHELTKRCASDSVEKLAGTVAGALIDRNPHQLVPFGTRCSQGSNRAEPCRRDHLEPFPRSAGPGA